MGQARTLPDRLSETCQISPPFVASAFARLRLATIPVVRETGRISREKMVLPDRIELSTSPLPRDGANEKWRISGAFFGRLFAVYPQNRGYSADIMRM